MRNSYTRTDGAHRRISQLRYTRIHQLEINWTTPHKNCVDNWPDSYRSFGRKPAADRAGFSCSSGLLLVDHKHQYNKPIKDLMRAHCGMSEPHATVAIAWFLYVRTEQALEPWKLVAPHHWQTPNQRRVVSTTNATGAPALFDTNFSWEDGNGIQHGWGGRSH